MLIKGESIICLTGQDFIQDYPLFKHYLPGIYTLLKKDPSYEVRIATKDGEVIDFEFGYPSDEWRIKAPNAMQ